MLRSILLYETPETGKIRVSGIEVVHASTRDRRNEEPERAGGGMAMTRIGWQIAGSAQVCQIERKEGEEVGLSQLMCSDVWMILHETPNTCDPTCE